MLTGETIIYFGPEPWEGLWRNRHQLMSRFARDNDVWYVEPPTNIREVLKFRRSRLTSRDASGVNVFHSPWWLPYTGRRPFREPSLKLFFGVLRHVTRSDGRPIVWFSRPAMAMYLDQVHAKRVVYHVVDEYSGYGQPSRTESRGTDPNELIMLERADTVIVVTPTLYESRSPYNANTHVVANAVDFEAYANPDTTIPEDMAGIRGPVIGYSGLVAARIDLEMLRAAATQRPEWSFVFVGTINEEHCEGPMRQLRALPNVHMLGNKPVNEVPSYVASFDVCVIPYTVNLRAQHASPLKLYEYAAASKPIVTTDFAAARAFEGTVRIANDADEFIAACEASLDVESNRASIGENRRIAAENTWMHRVRQISEILS